MTKRAFAKIKASIDDAIACSKGKKPAYPQATFVGPLDDYKIYVELSDGRTGAFDLKPYLDQGVFRELRDKNYFANVRITLGTVTWPHGQDIAPETLASELEPLS